MVARRARSIEISGIRKMFEGAPAEAVNLGLGEPDFDPPEVVRRALEEAVEAGQNHYGPSAGLPSLRDEIAEKYRSLTPSIGRDSVVVTSGGTEGLMSTALTLYDPGDEVLVPDPGFVLYRPHATLAGATPVPYDLDERNGFQPDLDRLEAQVTPRTRAIVVNSPANPTGALLPSSTVDRIAAMANERRLTVISDEVYESMVYEGDFASFWGRADRVVVVQSFSKMFAMTGWRLGFVLAAPELAAEINKVHYHLVACPSTPAQFAALAGLRAGPSANRAMLREFRARRELVVRLLAKVPGLTAVPPAGAFYAFPRFDWPLPAPAVAQALLARGLITTPGEAFGSNGARHLRLSFANSRQNLRRGFGILRAYAQEARR